ncbi:hypothetical protein TELCIR_16909 [Teladorsagia circumcincta]|uniref:Peptidase A2 domain-containing protein n=1 Tax=Teladorsagia circumcincta TaxID=45464 RepID=A0A2G9TU78_TELCI|nr:hypothetical protein TELCIR_16909 [Teladorsagia circumcincta]
MTTPPETQQPSPMNSTTRSDAVFTVSSKDNSYRRFATILVDTAADITIINEATWNLMGKPQLLPSSQRIRLSHPVPWSAATLRFQAGAKPVFRPKRPVPYAALASVEKELERLEANGVISKVNYSEWAAPISL